MNRLRQNLGRFPPTSPVTSKTLPGRGYRFIASIQATVQKAGSGDGVRDSRSERSNRHPRRSCQKRSLAAVGSRRLESSPVLAGAYIATKPAASRESGLYKTSSDTPAQHLFPPDGYALEAGSSRSDFSGRSSPDGARLAFYGHWMPSGAFQTFIRDLDAHESRPPLPIADIRIQFFWAPDGRSLFPDRERQLAAPALSKAIPSRSFATQPPHDAHGPRCSARNLLISGAHERTLTVPVSGGHARSL